MLAFTTLATGHKAEQPNFVLLRACNTICRGPVGKSERPVDTAAGPLENSESQRSAGERPELSTGVGISLSNPSDTICSSWAVTNVTQIPHPFEWGSRPTPRSSAPARPRRAAAPPRRRATSRTVNDEPLVLASKMVDKHIPRRQSRGNQ